MRDSFRRELKKCNATKSGDGGGESSKPWAFFSQMAFLTDTLQPKNTQSSISDETSRTPTPDDEDSERSAGDLIEKDNLSTLNSGNENQHVQQKLFKSPLKKKKTNYEDKFLAIENKKVELFQINSKISQDPDYQFLISLLPHLKQVPQGRKLRVQMELMNVLLKDQQQQQQEQHNTFSPSPASSHDSSYSLTSNSQFNQQAFSAESDCASDYYHNFNP